MGLQTKVGSQIMNPVFLRLAMSRLYPRKLPKFVSLQVLKMTEFWIVSVSSRNTQMCVLQSVFAIGERSQQGRSLTVIKYGTAKMAANQTTERVCAKEKLNLKVRKDYFIFKFGKSSV